MSIFLPVSSLGSRLIVTMVAASALAAGWAQAATPLPSPPEIDAARSKAAQVQQAPGVSADAKVRVRNELQIVENQFQNVWQPLQQAYGQVMNKRAELDIAASSIGDDIQAHNGKPHVFTLPDEQRLLDAYDAEAARLRQRQEVFERRMVNELRPLVDAMQAQADQVQKWLNGPTLANFDSLCRRALSLQQDGPAMRQLKQADQQGRTYLNAPDNQASYQLRTPFDTSGRDSGLRVSDTPAAVVDLRGLNTKKTIDLRTLGRKIKVDK